MTSLTVTTSRDSRLTSSSQSSLAVSVPSSSSSPSPSFMDALSDPDDDENATITIKKVGSMQHEELDDLRLLAISTHMTELSYSLSDIQARIFGIPSLLTTSEDKLTCLLDSEIQELRHKSHSSGDSANTTNIIDQSLAIMDDKLELVAKGIKSINDTIDPLLKSSSTPTVSSVTGKLDETAALLRKHATLSVDWESVQKESEVLREELKEDKWLTVFRTVTDQADGMMSSLEKAVNRCQDFIWQVHRRGPGGMDDPYANSQTSLPSGRNDKNVTSFEVFTTLLESYEAKKKHYMPATSKVLSIIDKGVQERVTKNGETLRRHAESAQRWHNIRERISRTDAEMDNVRRMLLSGDTSSDAGSSTSGQISKKKSYLTTPSNGPRMSRASSAASTISETLSPLRMFARKLTGSARSTNVTPLPVKNKELRVPSSEPILNNKSTRTSFFGSVRTNGTNDPSTPERPSHKYTQSLTPESSPRSLPKVDTNSTSKSNVPARPTWNISTKVEPEERIRTIRATPPRRAPSTAGYYGDIPPVPPVGAPYRRSLSRASIASSRPWSPISSSISTTLSGSQQPPPLPSLRPPSRPPSRAQTPSRVITPMLPNTPRPRARTPSHIPLPKGNRSISTSAIDGLPLDDPSRALSPTFSVSGSVSGTARSTRRASKIPIPSFQFSTPSRPVTSMSDYNTPDSPTHRSMYRNAAVRAQTPEIGSRHPRRLQASVSGGSHSSQRSMSRPPLPKMPPSSFRDGSVNGSGNTPSRPGSRAGAHTPATAMLIDTWSVNNIPVHEYSPSSLKDPLDVEVANILNSLGHGFLVERVSPPLKRVPKDGEEVTAQYRFSTKLSSKTVTLKLTTMNRKGGNGAEVIKKVMCRVGGGWQVLSDYVLNRQI